MTLPIVEKARERLAGRPDLLALVDDAVVAHFELMPAEVKALAALLLADGDLLEASRLAATTAASYQMAVDNLAKRGLVLVAHGQVDLSPMQARLRVESESEAADGEHLPEPRITFRSLREQVAALATDTRGLGRAYTFIFGRRPSSYPVLGRIGKELGVRRAAQFLLEHALDNFDGDPLGELLPQAIWLAQGLKNGGVRPEDAPDEAERTRELLSEDSAAWRERMRRWLSLYGSAERAVDVMQQAAEAGVSSGFQAEMDCRQVRLDFERWEREGKPEV